MSEVKCRWKGGVRVELEDTINAKKLVDLRIDGDAILACPDTGLTVIVLQSIKDRVTNLLDKIPTPPEASHE